MKRFLITMLSLLMIVSFAVTCFSYYDYSGGERTSLLIDNADLIPDDSEQELLEKLENISNQNSCEIAVLTVNSTDGQDITEFADDYYDYNGFGYGANDDGLLLVIDMGYREFAITTYGTAIDIFTDYNLVQLENAFVGYLSNGEYYNAFSIFITKCDNIIYDYKNYLNNNQNDNYYYNDEYYNNDYHYTDDYYGDNGINSFSVKEMFSLKWIAVAIIIGIIIAFIYTGSLKSKLKTVRAKPTAKDYVVPGSLQITQQKDIFMHSSINKVPKPKANNNRTGGGSSFGGGSSTHRSSSGRSHGGSRGRF